VTFSILDTVGANTISYLDSTASPGNAYTYQVKAVNVGGDSPYSNQASVNIPALPADPTNLTATAFSPTQVDLAWTDNAVNEDGFVIERSVDGSGTWSPVGQTAADAVAFSDLTVSPATTYWYQVYAFNIAGNSLPASSGAVMTPDAPPAPPSNLPAANVTDNSLTLNWQDNSNNETGFNVQMAATADFGSILNTVNLGANVTSASFTGLTANTTYYFRVEAVNGAGSSGWSDFLAVTTAAVAPSLPAAPSNLSATNVAQTSLTLNWQDNSNNEAGFTVQVATNQSFTNNLQTFSAGANVTTWNFTGLTRNRNYYFRVAAVNAAGASAWSPTLNVRTLR